MRQVSYSLIALVIRKSQASYIKANICPCELFCVQQALQEAMQTGHLAVSKHGLSACLPARTGIVAVASPIGGHLAAVKTLQENAKLPPSLLASFDLIYELKDQQNVHIDAGEASEAVHIRALTQSRGLL